MRILLLSNLYPPYVEGGAEILAGEIGAGLARLGHPGCCRVDHARGASGLFRGKPRAPGGSRGT